MRRTLRRNQAAIRPPVLRIGLALQDPILYTLHDSILNYYLVNEEYYYNLAYPLYYIKK